MITRHASHEFVENWFDKKRTDNMPVLVAEINGQCGRLWLLWYFQGMGSL